MGVREVGMFIVEMNVGLHLFCHPGSNEPLNCCLFLGSDTRFLPIMSLPFRGKEIGEATQPFTLSLDLSLPFAEMTQPVNISGHPVSPMASIALVTT